MVDGVDMIMFRRSMVCVFWSWGCKQPWHMGYEHVVMCKYIYTYLHTNIYIYIYLFTYIYSHIRWRERERERERDSHIIMGARGYWISQVSQSTLGGRSQLGVTLMNGDYEPTQTSGLLNADPSAARCTYKCNEQIWDT